MTTFDLSSPPPPDVLFDAIRNHCARSVKAYFDAGGLVSVRSAEGRTPLAETACLLVAELDLPEGFSFFGGQHVAVDKPMNEAQKKLHEIGCILLDHGANYYERAARTNRSIMINQMIASRLPETHKEWSALHQKNLMLGNIGDSLRLKTGAARKRKM